MQTVVFAAAHLRSYQGEFSMSVWRLLVVTSAVFLSGCATSDLEYWGLPYPVTSAERAAYGPRPAERFKLADIEIDKLHPKFRRQEVKYKTTEPTGTIVVDVPNRYLYLVGDQGRAMRYAIEVGRDGFGWSGEATIDRKADWPVWTPPAEMVARDPKVAPFAAGMPGGPENPLGARAMYLFQNGKDTLYRIHGGGHPTRLGKATSSGCIRLLDHDVIDLYARVGTGTRTVVLADENKVSGAPAAEAQSTASTRTPGAPNISPRPGPPARNG